MTIYYHNHHIIPRHMGGTDEPENLVKVTIEEHATLHKQLWEDLGYEEDRLAWLGLSGQMNMEKIKYEAIILGCKKAGKIHSEKYKNNEEYRKTTYEHLLKIGKIGGQKYKEKYPNGFKFKQSPQALKNQKEALAKINHQQSSKNSQSGTCWITNSEYDKKIKKEELDFWLKKGYTKGRKFNVN